MKINYNVSAMIANSALQHNDKGLSNSLEKLSSGLKINHAKDNASGLAMAKRMNAQIRSLEVANQNSNDGVSVIEIAEGALQEVEDMVQRMNELAVKACNGTMSDSDRKNIDDEIKQLKSEIERVAKTTNYNGQVLLDGHFDVKGYASDMNLKVTTYSDEVKNGEYSIKSIETAYFSDGRLDPSGCKIELGDSFPEGCIATFETDKIIVEGVNGFSMEFRVMPEDFENYKAENTAATAKVPNVKLKDMSDSDGAAEIESLDPKNLFPADAVYEADPGVPGRTIVKDGTTGTEIGSYVEGTGTLQISYPAENINKEYTYSGTMITETDNGATPAKTTTFAIDTDRNGKPVSSGSGASIHVLGHPFTLHEPGDPSDPEPKPIKLDITGLGSMKMQTGSNEGQELDVRIQTISLRTLGLDDKDCSTEENANLFLAQMSESISYISSARSKLGAYQNRLEHTISTLDISEENMTGAYSRIMDVDMAEEMTEYTKNNVLVQAGTSMLSQANERPSAILQLLQG